jgi:hypothetical protein
MRQLKLEIRAKDTKRDLIDLIRGRYSIMRDVFQRASIHKAEKLGVKHRAKMIKWIRVEMLRSPFRRLLA